ncbi:hypothetical protein [Chryseobacterium sp. MMS23-Vi53]|uniref:toxin-antitoxin system YwqK family antitoxin n=1 Tax=Chryseobacterium sp. MMS23-Vi53 TaxID=3386644 RepID=UPI0039EA1642
MKFKYYSAALLFVNILITAQYRDREYDSEMLNYTVLSRDKVKSYEEAFFKETEFSPEEFYTDLTKLDKNYDVLASLPPKGQTAELRTVIYDGFNTTTPFKNNVIDGVKKINYPDGTLFQEIPYKNGKIEGLAKTYDKYGQLLSEVPYKNNLKNGLKRVYFKDTKDRYDDKEYRIEGNYKNGELVGPVMISNDKLKIIYPSDFKKGKVELFYNDVSLVNYNIIDREVRNGLYTAYSISNIDEQDPKQQRKRIKSYTATYFNNEFNGYVEKYNKNGELLSKNLYSYGKPIGTHKSFYDVGKLQSEAYYDNSGNKTGTWKNYNLNGDVIEIINYKNDQFDGNKETYSNKTLKTQEVFENGKRLSNKYFDEGILRSEAYYDKDKFVKEVSYFNDGKVRSLNNAGNEIIYYDKDGKVIHTNRFKNGMPIGIQKFVDYEKDGSVRILSETEYDDKGKKIRSVWFDQKGGSTESFYKNGQLHGKHIKILEDGSKKTDYYFEGKLVKEAEFKQLSEEDKI